VQNSDILHQSTLFIFLAKFYPENLAEELQEIIQHLFFLQMRQIMIIIDVYLLSTWGKGKKNSSLNNWKLEVIRNNTTVYIIKN